MIAERVAWSAARLDADGVEVATFTAGSSAPDAPTALFLHGLGCWTEVTWDRVVARLDPAWRAVAFDLPGFGASAKPEGRYDIPFFRRTLGAVQQALAPGPVMLVGHSLGGLIAADYAGEFPERVAQLGLLAPAGFSAPGRYIVRALAGAHAPWLFAPPPPRRWVERLLRNAVADPATLDPAFLEAAIAQSRDPAVRRAFASVYAGAMTLVLDARKLRRRLARYTGPSALVWGERDRFTPVALPAARRTYPHAEITILADAGHLLPLEAPARVAATLMRLSVARSGTFAPPEATSPPS